MTLKQQKAKLRSLKQTVERDIRDATQPVRFGMVLVGSLLAGVSQFIPTTAPGSTAFVRALGILGVLLAFFGGFWTSRADRNASAALHLADEAIEHAREAEATAKEFVTAVRQQFDALRSEHLQGRRLHALGKILREGVEAALALKDRIGLEKAINQVLLSAYRFILAPLGFEAGERWTLTIYREEAGLLVDVAAFTVDRGAQEMPVRKWAVGHGFAGAAFLRKLEIVLADAQHPAALAVLVGPDTALPPDDAAKYRSVAAVPIRVSNRPLPWGVVIATSDKLGRFDPGETGPGALSADVVRLIADMIALLVAAHDTDQSPSAAPGPDLP